MHRSVKLELRYGLEVWVAELVAPGGETVFQTTRWSEAGAHQALSLWLMRQRWEVA